MLKKTDYLSVSLVGILNETNKVETREEDANFQFLVLLFIVQVRNFIYNYILIIALHKRLNRGYMAYSQWMPTTVLRVLLYTRLIIILILES